MSTTVEHLAPPEVERVIGPELLLLSIGGDILGTGVHALTGQVVGEVGVACASLVLTWTSSRATEQYEIAGVLVGLGVVLGFVTHLWRRSASRSAV